MKSVELNGERVVFTVVLDRGNSGQVFRESVISITGLSDSSGSKGARVLSVSNPEGAGRTPLGPSEILTGKDSIRADLFGWAKRNTVPLVTAVRHGFHETVRLAGEGRERWQAFSSTTEGREFIELLKGATADLKRQGEAGLEEFRKNQLPALQKKAARLRDRLTELGKTDEAQRFWREFTSDWSDGPPGKQ